VLLEFQPKDYLYKKYSDSNLADELYPIIFESSEWLDLDRGTITNQEAIKIFSARNTAHEHHIKDIMEDWHNILTPIEGTVNLLKRLKQNGHKIILLSNFHLEAFNFVYEKYSFFKLADELVISSKINLLKPHREIYEHMLNKLSLKPEECIFIDDTLANIKGAAKLGINIVLFKNPSQLETELEKMNLI
jgi:putative hydrolase of the HAD superfamily